MGNQLHTPGTVHWPTRRTGDDVRLTGGDGDTRIGVTRRRRNSNGAPFNTTGNAGNHYAGNPNTASLANSNNPHTLASQYDTACFQQTSNHP